MKILIAFFTLFLSTFAMADAWDNLTMEQAKAVVKELEKNPYIFDYCDCCDHSGEYAAQVHLVKVISTEIIECSWSPEHYSVQITTEVLEKLKYSASGPNTKKLLKPASDAVGEIVFMNYTWGVNPDTKKATPLFNIVDYSTYGEANACKKEFSYPSPNVLAKVNKDKGYEEWYKRVFGEK